MQFTLLSPTQCSTIRPCLPRRIPTQYESSNIMTREVCRSDAKHRHRRVMQRKAFKRGLPFTKSQIAALLGFHTTLFYPLRQRVLDRPRVGETCVGIPLYSSRSFSSCETLETVKRAAVRCVGSGREHKRERCGTVCGGLRFGTVEPQAAIEATPPQTAIHSNLAVTIIYRDIITKMRLGTCVSHFVSKLRALPNFSRHTFYCEQINFTPCCSPQCLLTFLLHLAQSPE